MPINFIASVAKEGTDVIPAYDFLKKWSLPTLALFSLKYYFGGSTNTWERDMHGKVALVTGGTSGLGAAVVRQLALKGCQIVLLVRHIDEWVDEYVSELRNNSGNPLIYAEECDLSDFYSVRKFATKWIDNTPPRRVDIVLCCAAVAQPPSLPRSVSKDGLEVQLQTNYFGHFHLLDLLSPSLRNQPPDRDVRLILTSCVANVMADLDIGDLAMANKSYDSWKPYRVLGSSKLALCLMGYEFQRQFAAYERRDKTPSNVHVALVDPGMMRSPSFKRFISFGSLWGLLAYLLFWPIWWVLLKTSMQGAQSVLFALMNPDIVRTHEVAYISECTVRSKPPRKEFADEEYQKQLFEETKKVIAAHEKESVMEQKRKEAQSGVRKDTKKNEKAKTGKPKK